MSDRGASRSLFRIVCIIWVAFVVVAAWVGPTAAETDSRPSASWLPADVCFYLQIPDKAAFRERWQHSLSGRLAADPDFAAFRAEMTAMLQGMQKQFGTRLPVSLDDLGALGAGEVVIAAAVQDTGSLAVAVMIDLGRDDAVANRLLAQLERHFLDQGFRRSTGRFSDTVVTSFRIAARSEGGDDGGDGSEGGGEKAAANGDSIGDGVELQDRTGELGLLPLSTAVLPLTSVDAIPVGVRISPTWFVHERTLVLSSHAEFASLLLNCRQSVSDQVRLVDDKKWNHIRSRCGAAEPSTVCNWFVRPSALFRGLAQSDGEMSLGAEFLLTFAAKSGLEGVRALGGSYSLGRGELDALSRTFVWVDKPTRGLLNLFCHDEGRHTPPDWVHERVMSWYSAYWRIQDAYRGFESVLDLYLGPGGLERFVVERSQEENGPQIHLRHDLFEQLAGRFHFVSDRLGSKGALRVLLAFECKSADKMAPLLTRSAAFFGIGHERIIDKVPVYASQPEASSDPGFGAAVVGDWLMVSTDASFLRDAIRSERPALRHLPAFRRLVSQCPQESAVYHYQDYRRLLEPVYARLRAGRGSELLPKSKAFFRAVDFSTLPAFGAYEKYQRRSMAYAVGDDRGMLHVRFRYRNSEPE